LAFLTGVVAVVAFAVAMPAAWVATHVADEDGYVALSRGVLDDEDTRTAVVEAVVSELDGQTRERLVQLGIPRSLIDQTLAEVAGFVGQGLASQPVVDAWGEAQRQAHRQMFTEGGESAFVVELAPLVDAVATQAGLDLEVPASLPVVSDTPEAQRAIAAVEASPGLMVGAGLVAVVAAVGAVALSRRRGAALAWLGVGGLVVTGLLYLAGGVASAPDPSAGTGAGERVALVLVDVARASFDDQLLRAAIGAGVLLVVGVLVGVAARVSRGRSVPGSTSGP